MDHPDDTGSGIVGSSKQMPDWSVPDGRSLKPLHSRTPLIESAALTGALNLPNCKVWLKLDNCQPTGSFKIRGVGRMVQRAAVESGCQWVVTSSGGNAGLAAAYAARRMGLACTVVVPRSTPETMRRRIADEGAEVLVHGDVWREAHDKAEELMAAAVGDRAASVLVHPYDHPDVWTGNSTLVDEIYEEGIVPDAIVLAVGGGGLLCGVAEGLQRRGAAGRVPIFAAETVGADCLASALAAGEPVTLQRITSRATSLGASRVCQAAWDLTVSRAPLNSVVCTDAEAAAASLRFLDEHLMLTELACGAALSVVYNRRIAAEQLPELSGGGGGGGGSGARRNIVVVVCGGRNVTVGQLTEVAKL